MPPISSLNSFNRIISLRSRRVCPEAHSRTRFDCNCICTGVIVVLQLSAREHLNDDGGQSPITYSIVGGNMDSAFAIDSHGTVTTNAQLDREIVDSYSLTVMASDYGVPPITASTQLTIDGNTTICAHSVITLCSHRRQRQLTQSAPIRTRHHQRDRTHWLTDHRRRCKYVYGKRNECIGCR